MFSITSISIIRPLTAITNFITNKFTNNDTKHNKDDLEYGVAEEEHNSTNNSTDTSNNKYTIVVFDIHEYLASLV